MADPKPNPDLTDPLDRRVGELRSVARVVADWQTTHDAFAEGYDLFDYGTGVEIESVHESKVADALFPHDDAEATRHVLRKAQAGDPHALRTLCILLAKIALPVSDVAHRLLQEGGFDEVRDETTITYSADQMEQAARATF